MEAPASTLGGVGSNSVRGRGVEPLRLAAAEPKADLGEATAVDPQDSAGFASGSAGGEGREEGSPPRSAAASMDAIEAALADALAGATEAGRWDVVAQLARELEARRLARAGNVVVLRGDRAKR